LRVEDKTGNFSPDELQELVDFIHNDLLSTPTEANWLDVIKILYTRSSYRGYWRFGERYDRSGQKITGIAAVIILNNYYLKTIEAMKEVLAHEYGHHWTLSYALVYQKIIDIWKERMPKEYYQCRGLNEKDYACDYSKTWYRCDKEIIAEDYRVLFAPAPYNENHRIVNADDSQLIMPSMQVKDYIQNLQNSGAKDK